MIPLLDSDLSRRDTTLVKSRYLEQLPVGAVIGSRAWVRSTLRLRIAESRADRHLVADIVRHRHCHGAWPCPPRTLILSYVAGLDGVEGSAGAGGLVMVALLPGQYHVTRALGLGQLEVLTLVRMWRADDLVPAIAPDFTPEMLRRVVRGERNRGPLRGVREEWIARKCRVNGLRAAPRLLATYADPARGHDGATYTAAGATFCGRSSGGKFMFAWALDPALRPQLVELGRAVEERSAA